MSYALKTINVSNFSYGGLTYSADNQGTTGSDTTNNSIFTTAMTAASSYGIAAVYIPAGYYLLTGTIYVPSNVTVYGDGSNATVIAKTTTSGNLFQFNGSKSNMRGISITSNTTGHTGGAAIYIVGDGTVNSDSYTLHDIYIANVYIGILFDKPTGTDMHATGTIFVSQLTIVNMYDHGILINHCKGSAYFSQVYITGNSSYPNMIGVAITEGDTYYLTDFDIVGCNLYGIVLKPFGAQQLSNITLAQVYCDSIAGTNYSVGGGQTAGTGFYASGASATAPNTLTRVRLINCWSSTNFQYGFYFADCDHIEMVETYCLLNGNHGIFLDTAPGGTVDQFRMSGGQVLLNGNNPSSVAGDGLSISAGISNFSINDGVFGGTIPDQLHTNLQRFGINLITGSSDYYMIRGCDTHLSTGLMGVKLFDGGSGTHKNVNNNL